MSLEFFSPSPEKLEREEPQLLDSSVLSTLESYGGDQDFLASLYELFEKHGLESMVELEQAIAKLDLKAIQHVSHRWRGSCLNVGALFLAELLKKLEEMTLQPQPQAIKLLEVSRLCSEVFAKTCLSFQSRLPLRPPS